VFRGIETAVEEPPPALRIVMARPVPAPVQGVPHRLIRLTKA
jgi:hypothetical protein